MPRTATDFRYVLQLHRPDGWSSPLLQAAVEGDFGPLVRCVQFEWARRDPSPPVRLDPAAATVRPCWDPQRGPPYLAGLQVEDDRQAAEPVQVGSEYFGNLAKQMAEPLIKEGRLQPGETYRYHVCAYPATTGGQAPRAAGGFTVEPVVQPLPLGEGSLSAFQERSTPSGPASQGEFPAFVPQTVIDQAGELTVAAGAAETGGILIGRLLRDFEQQEIFAEVTAQIPARLAQQALTTLTFNKETWADVEGAIRLRGRDEIYLGWWHSHPARQWCKDCPVENRKVCKLSGEFFSSHDVALHEAVFSQPYHLALVISDSYAAGVTWPLFGWRNGRVSHRPFSILA